MVSIRDLARFVGRATASVWAIWQAPQSPIEHVKLNFSIRPISGEHGINALHAEPQLRKSGTTVIGGPPWTDTWPWTPHYILGFQAWQSSPSGRYRGCNRSTCLHLTWQNNYHGFMAGDQIRRQRIRMRLARIGPKRRALPILHDACSLAATNKVAKGQSSYDHTTQPWYPTILEMLENYPWVFPATLDLIWSSPTTTHCLSDGGILGYIRAITIYARNLGCQEDQIH